MPDHISENAYQHALHESARNLDRGRISANIVATAVVLGFIVLTLVVFALISDGTMVPNSIAEAASRGLLLEN